jgi:tetratricopeptide (TPR) repeat protein
MAATAELANRAPGDPQRLYDHAQNVFWVGWVARDRGQLGQAEAAMREYRRLAEKMVAAAPANPEWRMEQGNANVNLGIVLLDRRRFAEATRRFTEALRSIDTLAAAEPVNAAYQRSLAETLAWLADAQQSEGRFDEAVAQRQRHLRLLDRLIASSGGDVLFKQRLVPSNRALGNVYASQGKLDLAIRHLRAALSEADKLIQLEPDNSKWMDGAAKARINLAELLLSSRQAAEAASQASVGCRLFETLLARDNSVALWRAGLRDCHSIRARIALASGAPDEALRQAGQALDAAESVKSSDSVSDRYFLARVHLLIGDIHRRLGDDPSARLAWEAGLKALPPGVTERPPEMADRAELLRRLGRNMEAGPLAQKLAAMGYRRTS